MSAQGISCLFSRRGRGARSCPRYTAAAVPAAGQQSARGCLDPRVEASSLGTEAAQTQHQFSAVTGNLTSLQLPGAALNRAGLFAGV